MLFGASRYRSEAFDDECSTVWELYETYHGQESKVARITYWDALGQYYVETLGREVPAKVIVELFAEAQRLG